MKTKKIKQLMERGLSHKLLLTMNEGQINQLHKMMVGEQVKGSVMLKKGIDPKAVSLFKSS